MTKRIKTVRFLSLRIYIPIFKCVREFVNSGHRFARISCFSNFLSLLYYLYVTLYTYLYVDACKTLIVAVYVRIHVVYNIYICIHITCK